MDFPNFRIVRVLIVGFLRSHFGHSPLGQVPDVFKVVMSVDFFQGRVCTLAESTNLGVYARLSKLCSPFGYPSYGGGGRIRMGTRKQDSTYHMGS